MNQGRTSLGAQRAIIIEAETLIVGGMPDTQVVRQLMRPRNEDEQPSRMCSRTAHRYVTMAWQQINRESKRSARAWRSVGIAKREFAQRRALGRQKIMVLNGQVIREPDPDVATYLAAVESEAKLLGLNAPDRQELYVAGFTNVFRMQADVLREELAEHPEIYYRIVNRFHKVMEAVARRAASGAIPAEAAEPPTVDALPAPPKEGMNGVAHG